jgi:hypothetical protein
MYCIGTPLAFEEGTKDSEEREFDFAGERVYA